MINNELKEYLNNNILPQYDKFDKGHNRDHILAVAAGTMELAEQYDVNRDMLYTAALFHDLGLSEGRDTHHITSARMLKNDSFIKKIFSTEEILIIAESIEDHRASAKSEPRSIYGKILSSADRLIEPDTIIRRSFYHSEVVSPHFSTEEHINAIYNHITNKYSEGGYLKMPIITKRNAEGLAQLRELHRDEKSFKEYCAKLLF